MTGAGCPTSCLTSTKSCLDLEFFQLPNMSSKDNGQPAVSMADDHYSVNKMLIRNTSDLDYSALLCDLNTSIPQPS